VTFGTRSSSMSDDAHHIGMKMGAMLDAGSS
jgi:hypothetical protein